MSSFDKVVKLACKPKAKPPKAKYLDPIIAATWSEDGAVHDVCKALTPRFREPNAIVVFKALIVLHTMIRNGATDNVLGYLSSSDVLRLKNVVGGNWEGYNAPQNLQHYAVYLDSRIRAYRELKHDVVRVQAESNRDMRNSVAVEDDAYRSGAVSGNATGSLQRNKTITGRKLRIMTVEKGLLRETKIVHRVIDHLVECRFYLDDLEDELTITALRMLVKDLLILFQAGNEGVINVLEHYFEMSRVDAETALDIYTHFCKQTVQVVEYLGVAKKLQNLLNVSIPNLKHAPVSLAGALREYLDDPNFEQNRIEYKTNKAAAEKAEKTGVASRSTINQDKKTATASSKTPAASTISPATTSTAPVPPTAHTKANGNQAMVDFFTSIEEEQPTMFNPQTGSPSNTHFQQQAVFNPFVQRQMTGMPNMQQPFGMNGPVGQIQPQPTGFLMPQNTAVPAPNPFGLQAPPSQPQHRPFSAFLQPQATGFLQTQATGANPFRQSMLLPQMTGMPSFNVNTGPAVQPNSGPQPFPFQPPAHLGPQQTGTVANPISTSSVPKLGQPSAPNSAPFIPRPASTPLRSMTSPPLDKPIKTHQTGSRNPFGSPVTPPPAVPKAPTLMEIAMGLGGQTGQEAASPNGIQPQQTGAFNMFNTSAPSQPTGSQLNPTMTGAGASPFFMSKSASTTTPGVTSSNPLTTQPTGPASSITPSFTGLPSALNGSALKPQTTGFGGIKAFKPTSSFGASLLESLPPIPQSNPQTPAPTGNGTTSDPSPSQPPAGPGSGALNPQPTGFQGGFSSLNTTNVGLSPGVGLRPQMTGAVANPFRASMFSPGNGGFSGGLNTQSPQTTSYPFGISQLNATTAFNSNLATNTNAFGSPFSQPGKNASAQQQQPQPTGSLI